MKIKKKRLKNKKKSGSATVPTFLALFWHGVLKIGVLFLGE